MADDPELMLPCFAPHCDKPAVVFVSRRRGDAVVLLVRRDFVRTDHPYLVEYRAHGARCLDHAHDELDLAIEESGPVLQRPANWIEEVA